MPPPVKLNVVMVSPEVAPWSKVGGLGDVAKALPEALGRLGHRVMTVAPRYACYPEVQDTGISFPVELPTSVLREMGSAWATARLYRAADNFGVERVFIDHPIYEPEKNLPPHMVYGAGYNTGDDESGLDLRYSILCQGALAAPVLLWDDLPRSASPSPLLTSRVVSLDPINAGSPGPVRTPSMTRREVAAVASPAHTDPDIAQERKRMLEQLEMLSGAILNNPQSITVASASALSSAAAAVLSNTISLTAITPNPASPVPMATPPTGAASPFRSAPESGPSHPHGKDLALRAPRAPAQGSAQASATAKGPIGSAGIASEGAAGGVTFVANDWATSLVALRLRHSVQSGYMRQKYAWARGSSTPPMAVALGVMEASAHHGDTAFPLGLVPPEREDEEHQRVAREREHATRLLGLAEVLEAKLGAARCAFCIHNLAFQGSFSARSFPRLCLPPSALAPLVNDRHLSGLLRQYADRSAQAAPAPAGSPLPSAARGPSAKARQARADPSDPSAQTAARVYAFARGDVSALSDPELQSLLRSIPTNWLKAALEESDLVVTVSPGYAGEILRDEDGMGLADVLRDKGVCGILNGIDTTEWDPQHDIHLPWDCRFTPEDVQRGKAQAKRQLQETLGLTVDPTAPLVGFVGRLEDQKGMDILLSALPALMPRPEPRKYGPVLAPPLPLENEGGRVAPSFAELSLNSPVIRGPSFSAGVPADLPADMEGPPPPEADFPHPQWVILGKGSKGLEALVSTVGSGFPGRAVGVVAFDVALSHLIMAACDYLIVPSRFEPCGLVQLAAMRYGTLPIVASVGGLKDSVPLDVGYHMGRMGSSDPEELCSAVTRMVLVVKEALRSFGSAEWEERRRRAMQCEVSWIRSAGTWEACLRGLHQLS